MKSFERRSGLIAIAAVMCSGIAGAQQQRSPFATQLDAEAEEVRRYSVEVIVFEYLDSAGSSELFKPEEITIPDAGMDGNGTGVSENRPGNLSPGVDLADSDAPLSAESSDDATEPGMSDDLRAAMLLEPIEKVPTLEEAGFEILDPGSYQLNDIYNRLTRLDAYRPLMRGAWIQPALEQNQSIPLKLRRIGNPPLRLDGTITLYLSRFLHLVVDLSLEEKGPVRPMGGNRRIEYAGDNRVNARIGADSLFVTPSIFYRIQEDGILRSGELRYYDHPKFGVLAQVSRIEEETPDTADDTADLLPANR